MTGHVALYCMTDVCVSLNRNALVYEKEYEQAYIIYTLNLDSSYHDSMTPLHGRDFPVNIPIFLAFVPNIFPSRRSTTVP